MSVYLTNTVICHFGLLWVLRCIPILVPYVDRVAIPPSHIANEHLADHTPLHLDQLVILYVSNVDVLLLTAKVLE